MDVRKSSIWAVRERTYFTKRKVFEIIDRGLCPLHGLFGVLPGWRGRLHRFSAYCDMASLVAAEYFTTSPNYERPVRSSHGLHAYTRSL